MGAVVKLSVKNVIDLWFAEDTPIRQYRVRMNPKLWATCEKVSKDFIPPSGRLSQQKYRKSDKVAFAKLVLSALGTPEEPIPKDVFELTY